MSYTPQQPEPCLSAYGTHCYSPTACESFGYCRERNIRPEVNDSKHSEKSAKANTGGSL